MQKFPLFPYFLFLSGFQAWFYQMRWFYPYRSFTHSKINDVVKNYVTQNTDLLYSRADFLVEIGEKISS